VKRIGALCASPTATSPAPDSTTRLAPSWKRTSAPGRMRSVLLRMETPPLQMSCGLSALLHVWFVVT
jgi:hypothetical protein